MKLVIDISALDKTKSAVASATDTTPLSSLQQLVLGDTEPLDITFTDSSTSPPSVPAWAGAGNYQLVVGLGALDANARLNYTATTSFVGKSGGWTGYIALTTYDLQQAVIMSVTTGGGWSNIATDPRSRNQRPNWCYLWLQIQVIDPNGNAKTYGQLRVVMVNRTLPANVLNVANLSGADFAWARSNLVCNGNGIVGLASSVFDATKLGGLNTANGAMPVGAVFALNFSVNVNDGAGVHTGIMTLLYRFIAGTNPTQWPLFGRPWDYDASSNANVWRLVGAFLDTLPASYNATTGKFHYIAVSGAANAVFVAPDQTGTAAPA